jgi:hypothetical protein
VPLRALASQAPEIIVEIAPAARELINARVTRRLIELELAEVKLAPHPKRANDTGLSLFYRLTLHTAGELRIELWERGEFYGARRVSTSHGNKKLLARHIALATAELAQRLSRAHTQSAKLIEREQEAERQRQVALRIAQRHERWALLSSADASGLPASSTWLFGPRLGVQLNQPRDGRLEISGAWLMGPSNVLATSNTLQWLELKLSPSYRLDAYSLAVGADVAATLLQFGGPVSVDAIPGQHQTWSAHAGGHVHYQPRISEHFRLHLGLSGSILLRQVLVQADAGPAARLKGLWLGLSFGALIDS